MTIEQTLFFFCPNCEERFAQVEEPDRDLHTGRYTTAVAAASGSSSTR